MNSSDLDRLLSEAGQAYARGDLRLAEGHITKALEVEPTDVSALVLSGLIFARTARKPQAISSLERAIELDPTCYEAYVALSTLLFSEGRHEEAIQHGRAAIDLHPDDVDSYRHLSRDLIRHGKLAEALPILRRAAELGPNEALVHRDLATTLSELGQLRESAKAWERVVAIAPGVLAGWLKLGGLWLSMNEPAAAVRCGREAVKLDPKSPDARILLALALSETGGAGEAEPHLVRAIELQPGEYVAHAALGLALQEQGRFDEARTHLQRTIKLSPTNGQAYYSLVRSKRMTPEDRGLIQRIEAVSEDEQASLLDRSYMQYALGKAKEDLKEYEAAIGHYDLATDLAAKYWFGGRPPDHAWYRSMIQGTIETFTADRLRELRAHGSDSDKPLLVVGMMRSGTTLVEQIVSSHPEVQAGGELTYWHDFAGKVFDPITRTIDQASLLSVGNGYRELLDELGPNAARVTDKLPHNYVMLGFVLAAFPNARVIHVRRNPIDNCLSIYTTAFNRPPEFALRRENIVFAYREYERMMAHWRAILPSHQLLEVSYESLIADRESETRRMVEFSGLPWQDSCLHHEQNNRSVNTPSVWQVRQPIYNTSVERWRRFEPWLEEFASLETSV